MIRRLALGLVMATALLAPAGAAESAAGTTIAVSLNSAGEPGDCGYLSVCYYGSAISADGRYVAFATSAANLDPACYMYAVPYVFLRDLLSGTTKCIGTAGAEGPVISADGMTVAFFKPDGSGAFVYHADTDTTSTIPEARGLPSLSSDGSMLLVVHADGHSYLHNLVNSTVEQSPVGGTLSGNGRFITFQSVDGSLVPNDTNNNTDIFVYDRTLGTTERVSIATNGTEADCSSAGGYPACSVRPRISYDGRFVLFDSIAPNLVPNDTNGISDGFLHDRDTGETSRITVGAQGEQLSSYSGSSGLSGNGRFVAFSSSAPLVADDYNGYGDIFVRDRLTGVLERISVGHMGQEGIVGAAGDVSFTPDGRLALFVSGSSNLVPGVPGGLFMRDLGDIDNDGEWNPFDPDADADGLLNASDNCPYVNNSSQADYDHDGVGDVCDSRPYPGVTTRVSVSSVGAQGLGGDSESAAISADGRYVVFSSTADGLTPDDTDHCWVPDICRDIFLRDRQLGTTILVSKPAPGIPGQDVGSEDPDISADGRFVAFASQSTNLVAGDSNNFEDIFLYDRLAGTIEIVGLSTDGAQPDYFGTRSPSVSNDGRFVAFESWAGNLVPGDANYSPDVFVRDRVVGTTTRVSVRSDGSPGTGWSFDPDISADGRFVAFDSNSDLTPGEYSHYDVYVHDRQTAVTELVSVGSRPSSGDSAHPSISADGRYVAFGSAASLDFGDNPFLTDIFVRDRQVGSTERVSVASGGVPANGRSFNPSISGDGRIVAFQSMASNLTEGDTLKCYSGAIDWCPDVFVHDRQTHQTVRASDGREGSQPDDLSDFPSASGNGQFVAFQSQASNLVSGDTNVCPDDWDPDTNPENCRDVFVHDLGDGDSDGELDPFDPDDDADGVADLSDGCLATLPGEPVDSAGCSDAQVDPDADGVCSLGAPSPGPSACTGTDNCPTVSNAAGQLDDFDGDLAGDACDGPGTGNVDCNGPSNGVTAVDALKVLRWVAALSVTQSEPCLDIDQPRDLPPPDDRKMGDVDCSGSVNAVDALKTLRALAGLTVAKPAECPPIIGPPP